MIRPGQKVFFKLWQGGKWSYLPKRLYSKYVDDLPSYDHDGTIIFVNGKGKRKWFLVEYGEEERKIRTCFNFNDVDRYVKLINERTVY